MDYITELQNIVEKSAERLHGISEYDSGLKPQPEKWSYKEIIGHLIDSAANNHNRFVRACFQDDLTFPGYDQDKWVQLQDYQHAPWNDLVDLWRLYNLQLVRVMKAIPDEIKQKKHIRHNLHLIAWETIPEDQPATLDYFMNDYVGHLKHHLKQILDLE